MRAAVNLAHSRIKKSPCRAGVPRQMLMTEEVEERFKPFPLYSQDGRGLDAVASAKLFSPYTGWTWLLTEYDPQERLAFGYVVGPEPEFGYISLDELEEANAKRNPQLVERDEFFTPKTLREALVELGRASLLAHAPSIETGADARLTAVDLLVTLFSASSSDVRVFGPDGRSA